MRNVDDSPGVYRARNVVNGKVLVGSSKKKKDRIRQHKRELVRNRHYNSYFQNSWNKHGADNFVWEILEECSEDVRLVREQWWIDHLQASNPEYGYNITHSVRSLIPAPLRSKISKKIWTDMTPEEREEQSRIRKARWDDPVWAAERVKELTAKGQKSADMKRADPEFKERCLSGLERNRKDPEKEAARIAKIKATWSKPETKAKQSERKQELNNDPVYMEGLRQRARDPNTKAKIRAANLKQFSDPLMREKQLEGLEKSREVRERKAERFEGCE